MGSTVFFLSVGCLLCISSVSAQLGFTPMCQKICSAYCKGRRNGLFLCSWCECDVETCGPSRCREGQICLRTRTLGWFGRSISTCIDLEKNKVVTENTIQETATTTTTTMTTTTTTPASTVQHTNQQLMIPLCAGGKMCTGQYQCGPGQLCVKENDLAITGRCCSKAVTNMKTKCMEEKVTGPCRAGVITYFYNTTSFQCEQFYYGGCDRGANHFESVDECQHECEDRCLLPKTHGNCRALFYNFYYNRETGECEDFQYSGCGGNGNKFQSLTECQIKCVDV